MGANDGGVPGCGICAIIAAIESGPFGNFIAELPTSYVVLGDSQLYRGYCVMLAKRHATELFLMPPQEAHALFEEVRLTAEAIAAVAKPWKLNYECLGNSEPHVHWHIFPRYESDPLRLVPIWVRPESERKIALDGGEQAALIAAIANQIKVRFPGARIAKS
ncbi:MAG TPA: HIT family protein [Candidatus Binataceae bacterium]|nr:HIT family protein [Candidatus Binataceae bacterium]